MILDNITYREYIELKDKSEYHFAMKYAFRYTTAKDELKLGDANQWSFGIVKDIQHELQEKTLNIKKQVDFICAITGIDIKEISKTKLDKLCRTSSYIVESILNIIETERKLLSHESSDIEKEAGLDRFEGLGIYLQIQSLTNKDVTNIEAVRNTKYIDCFLELYTRKQQSDFEKSANEVVKRRSKYKS